MQPPLQAPSRSKHVEEVEINGHFEPSHLNDYAGTTRQITRRELPIEDTSSLQGLKRWWDSYKPFFVKDENDQNAQSSRSRWRFPNLHGHSVSTPVKSDIF